MPVEVIETLVLPVADINPSWREDVVNPDTFPPGNSLIIVEGSHVGAWVVSRYNADASQVRLLDAAAHAEVEQTKATAAALRAVYALQHALEAMAERLAEVEANLAALTDSEA